MTERPSTQTSLSPVRKSIHVRLPVEEAFRLFTEDIGRWWPLASHSTGGEMAETCIMEGHAGGRIYEVRKDGSQDDWGKVLVWEPPGHLVYTWHPGRSPETAQRVEMSFQPEGESTRVTLIHKGWELLGEQALKTREDYDSGWDYVLGKYTEYTSLQV
jgi:uncharacterized protein YndB with AHSA1/START domain